MSSSELIESFSLEGISGGNAVFDTDKLDWMNGQYIARLSIGDLVHAVEPFLVEAGMWPPAASAADDDALLTVEWFRRLVELLRPRAKRLTDFVDLARPYLGETVEYDADAVAKHLGAPGLADHVVALLNALRTVDPFDEPHVEGAVRGTAAERSIKAATLIHVTRVGVTGRTASPGLFEVLVLLGRARTIARLERLLNFLATRV
jgi:glutamyl-tRNA synthetase